MDDRPQLDAELVRGRDNELQLVIGRRAVVGKVEARRRWAIDGLDGPGVEAKGGVGGGCVQVPRIILCQGNVAGASGRQVPEALQGARVVEGEGIP